MNVIDAVLSGALLVAMAIGFAVIGAASADRGNSGTSIVPQPAGRRKARKLDAANIALFIGIVILTLMLIASYAYQSRPNPEVTSTKTGAKISVEVHHRERPELGDTASVLATLRDSACAQAAKGVRRPLVLRAPGFDVAGPDVARSSSRCEYDWLIASKYAGRETIEVAMADGEHVASTTMEIDVHDRSDDESLRTTTVAVLVALMALLGGRLQSVK